MMRIDDHRGAGEARAELAAILRLPALEQRLAPADAPAIEDTTASWGSLFGWAAIHGLGKLTGAGDYAEQSRSWIDEWRLGRILSSVLHELGADDPAAWPGGQVLKYLTSYQDWFKSAELQQPRSCARALLADAEVRQLLRINRYQGVLWFDKNAFEQLLAWLGQVALISLSAADEGTGETSPVLRAAGPAARRRHEGGLPDRAAAVAGASKGLGQLWHCVAKPSVPPT
ncbi:hypothetical protein [Kouleothrix sp.]|uniref:hypothetical protein n=1 Tax=Kouleothrix sp. TaxID=2779161 RepID=UPI003919DE93